MMSAQNSNVLPSINSPLLVPGHVTFLNQNLGSPYGSPGMSPVQSPFSSKPNSRRGSLAPKQRRTSQNPHRTELCRAFFSTGCNFGSDCKFAHNANDAKPRQLDHKYKTEACANFASGKACAFLDRCAFLHDEEVIVQGNGLRKLLYRDINMARVEVKPTVWIWSDLTEEDIALLHGPGSQVQNQVMSQEPGNSTTYPNPAIQQMLQTPGQWSQVSQFQEQQQQQQQATMMWYPETGSPQLTSQQSQPAFYIWDPATGSAYPASQELLAASFAQMSLATSPTIPLPVAAWPRQQDSSSSSISTSVSISGQSKLNVQVQTASSPPAAQAQAPLITSRTKDRTAAFFNQPGYLAPPEQLKHNGHKAVADGCVLPVSPIAAQRSVTC